MGLNSIVYFCIQPFLMKSLRLLLFPFSLIYGLVVILRNRAYDTGLLRSGKFHLPVISVGNLSVGGSGKSPMTENLVRLLSNKYKTAILSRGYGRKTSGFLLVDALASGTETGDEPLQFKRKFRDVTVAVCEDRVEGISRLEKDHDIIILDDAFQHRAVIPALSILLFDYNSLFKSQWLLPAGDLREPFAGKSRADIIVVTKTPGLPDQAERQKIITKINPEGRQQIFFSYLKYGSLRPLNERDPDRELNTIKDLSKIILLTGIANAVPLLTELQRHTRHIEHQKYPDHHNFSKKNISKLVQSFDASDADDKLIITTEKDAQRLRSNSIKELLKDLPVYYLPVEAEIYDPERALFNELVERYAAEPTINN